MLSPRKLWSEGPPPSIGWWPASAYYVDGVYRWWNGSGWSKAASHHDDAEEAARVAATPYTGQDKIFWKQRPKNWPQESRL